MGTQEEADPDDPALISHWHQLFDGLDYSVKTFYDDLSKSLRDRDMPGVKVSREEFAEGAVLSNKREYLRVRRGALTYHICAAPFGSAFFFSSWLHANTGCLAMLARVPLLGWPIKLLIRRLTFYSVDSAFMFQELIHQTLLAEVDKVTTAKNLQPLAGDARKPILSGFYARRSR